MNTKNIYVEKFFGYKLNATLARFRPAQPDMLNFKVLLSIRITKPGKK